MIDNKLNEALMYAAGQAFYRSLDDQKVRRDTSVNFALTTALQEALKSYREGLEQVAGMHVPHDYSI